MSLVENINQKMVVYCITNKINNKKYVGITINKIRQRINGHKSRFKRGGNYFYCAIRRYGIENFYVRIIEQCDNKKDLAKRELYWIKKFKTNDKNFGYNTLCEEYVFSKSRKGRKNSERHKKILSERMHEKKHEMIKLHQKQWILFSPYGERFDIVNLQKFCREQDVKLYAANLVKLTTDRVDSLYYKGWQCFKREGFKECNVKEFPMSDEAIFKNSVTKIKKTIKFTLKNGSKIITKDIYSFCKDYGLDPSAIYKLIKTGKCYKDISFEIIDFPQ